MANQEGDVTSTTDLIRHDGLSDDPAERLEQLRLLAKDPNAKLDHCPECGASLENLNVLAHAQEHWPTNVPGRDFSREAAEREAALYRVAGANPPRR